MKCQNCNHEINDDSIYCLFCGKEIKCTINTAVVKKIKEPGDNSKNITTVQPVNQPLHKGYRKKVLIIMIFIILLIVTSAFAYMFIDLYNKNQSLESTLKRDKGISSVDQNSTVPGKIATGITGSNNASIASSSVPEDRQDSGNKALLFVTKNGDCIYLDGKSIMAKKSQQMSVDLNGDGINEMFTIKLASQFGVEIDGATTEVK
jgi:hypothetical protein